MSERIIFLKKVLETYSKNMEKILKNEDLKESFTQDLQKNIHNNKRVSDNISKIVEFAVIDGVDYKKVICEALEWYIKDLEKGFEFVKDSLGITPTLDSTKKELETAKKTHEELCDLMNTEFHGRK